MTVFGWELRDTCFDLHFISSTCWIHTRHCFSFISFYKYLLETLEISINHTSTNVSVNFCQNSYIISLGGSRFFCYGQKKNLDLQKRKLYISIRTKSQSHRGSGPNVDSLGPDTCTRLSFGMGGWGGGPFTGREGPPISLFPLWFPEGWWPGQHTGWHNVALCHHGQVGGFTTRAAPAHSLCLTPLLKLVSDQERNKAADPTWNVPSLSNVIVRKKQSFLTFIIPKHV